MPTHADTEPVPDQADLDQARRRLQQEVYPYYARPGAQAQRELAQRLLADAASFVGSPVEAYVLLDEARAIAAAAGDTATAFEAVRLLADRFAVDRRKEQVRAALTLLETTTKEDRQAVVSRGLDLLSGFLSTLDSSEAEPLMDAMRGPVRRSGDRTLRFRYDALADQFGECRKAESALSTLQEEPDHKEANGIAGRYLCYRLGDASRGLPLLARASNRAVADLAARDLSAPQRSGDRLQLAKDWFALFEKAEGAEAKFFLARSRHWGEAALADADGYDEMELQLLLARIDAEENPAQPEPESEPVVASAPARAEHRVPAELTWADVVAEWPDPAVVTDRKLRTAIEESGLPWRVRHSSSGIEMALAPTDRDGEELLYVGVYEVQQTEWDHVMKGKPLGRKRTVPAMDHPWKDVLSFLDEAGDGLRLPTEAEWEAACRAGSSGPHYGELEAIAWHGGNSGARGHVVGEKAPNALGLYDTLGNAFEWCDNRRACGGSWRHPAEACNATDAIPTRGGEDKPPGPGVGFRVVRDPR